jgi:hypothetical protein
MIMYAFSNCFEGMTHPIFVKENNIDNFLKNNWKKLSEEMNECGENRIHLFEIDDNANIIDSKHLKLKDLLGYGNENFSIVNELQKTFDELKNLSIDPIKNTKSITEKLDYVDTILQGLNS